MNKLILSVSAVLAMLGLAVAFGPGLGYMTGSNTSQVSDDVRASFMKAMHDGDFETAKDLNEEYGLGGRKFANMNEELFDLMKQKRDAISSEQYGLAVSIQNQIREQMSELHQNSDFNDRGHGHRFNQNPAFVHARGSGMNNGQCPYYDGE